VTHRVYDCSQNGAQTGTTLSIGTIAGIAAGAKITTSYDSSTRELGVFILRNATSSAISAYRLGLGVSPTYPVSVGQTNYVVSANSNGVGDAFFDSSDGLHKLVSVRSGGLTIDVFTLPIVFTTQTLTTLDSETFTVPTILTNSSSSLVVKDNYAHFVYLDNVAARSLYYSKFKISSGSFLRSDNATLNQILTTATTSELTLIDGGVGTLSVPANGFSVGDSFRLDMGGVMSAQNGNTITIRLKSGSVSLGSSGALTMPSITNQVWYLTTTFTIRAIGAAGTASIVVLSQFHVLKAASGTQEGFAWNTVNSTTFSTTISNTLDITAQFSTNNAGNSIYSDIFTLSKTY
jgi:hypothetical protein